MQVAANHSAHRMHPRVVSKDVTPAILAAIWYHQDFGLQGDEEPVAEPFLPRNRGALMTSALDKCVVPPDKRNIRHRLQRVHSAFMPILPSRDALIK